MSTVRRTGLRFRSAFDRTGGEDTVFFHEMAQRGARIFFTRAALVFETPDRDRLTLSGVVRRAFRGDVPQQPSRPSSRTFRCHVV